MQKRVAHLFPADLQTLDLRTKAGAKLAGAEGFEVGNHRSSESGDVGVDPSAARRAAGKHVGFATSFSFLHLAVLLAIRCDP